MAAPTFFGAGVVAQGTSDIDVGWAAGHLADDIGLLIVQTANQAVATPSGWNAFTVSPQGTGTAATVGSTRLTMFWKRATSSAEATTNLVDAGDHIRGRILVFRGCETSGNPFDTTAGNISPGASTSGMCPGGITTIDECLIVASIANGTDIGSNQTVNNSWTNADLTSVTRIMTGNGISGQGGGVDVATGLKATAGAFGSTTCTFLTATAQAAIMIALKPPFTPPAETVTNGGFYIATGGKTVAGAIPATTATMDTAAVQARITIALKPPAAPPANLPPIVGAVSAKVATVGVSLSFALNISDPEDDALTVTLETGSTTFPTGAQIETDPDDGSFSFEWTPTADQTGEWNVILRADDGTSATDVAFNITVVALPPDTVLTVARDIAVRAQADAQAARELVDLLLLQQQMNANVITKAQALSADLDESQDFMADTIDQIDSGTNTDDSE